MSSQDFYLKAYHQKSETKIHGTPTLCS